MLQKAKGDEIPNETLARLVDGKIETVQMAYFVAGVRAAILGIPCAFTPACTDEHLPSFIRQAPRLKKAGFEKLICVSANDPWVVDAWSKRLDPDKEIIFLSDGNLDFARAMGLHAMDRKNFLGHRSRRYLITCDDGLIRWIKAEAAHSLVSFTGSDIVLIEA
ncbi:MAG TPA: peroxiredoxin [Caulobacterales bacterium]|nr:peroxiredoxin [Caulobacterales bacterium]